VLVILAFLFNDYDVSLGCSQAQVDDFSHLAYEEDDYVIQIICKATQIGLSFLSLNRESHALIIPSNHGSFSNNYHSIDHFPISISHDSCFTSFDLYCILS